MDGDFTVGSQKVSLQITRDLQFLRDAERIRTGRGTPAPALRRAQCRFTSGANKTWSARVYGRLEVDRNGLVFVKHYDSASTPNTLYVKQKVQGVKIF